jgi:ATP-dependent DNA helicase DinG
MIEVVSIFCPIGGRLPEEFSPNLPSLHAFFAPGGVLSRSTLPYEFRKGQLEMARAVERAFEEPSHLIVEAGTGTGKTMAYLLPALRLGRRIIISTGTKALQEQLFFKDIPLLESLLGPLSVCYMKGRSNYLCRHKMVALRDQPILNGLEEISQFNAIAAWERETETGDRAELNVLPENSQLWPKLDARGEACLGSSCPDYERCFITEMRRKAQQSDIIIVNHHLFFADLSIKLQSNGAPDAGVLPEAGAAIFDEAHELEDIASNYFGVSLSNLRFEDLVRDAEMLLRKAYSGRVGDAAASVRERSRMFFASLPAPADGRAPFDRRSEFLEDQGELYLSLKNNLVLLEGELENLKGVEEAPGLVKRTATMREQLSYLLEAVDRNTVFWVERRTLRGARPHQHTTLQATPIDVSGLLRDLLFERYPTIVLTSATLTVQGSFDHICKRLGLETTRTLVVPSHFNYEKQALLYLPPQMPDPRDPDFSDAAEKRIRQILDITHGRAFCLFTSYAQMRNLYDRLLPQLSFPLLLHGSKPRKALLEEFRAEPNAVLFGTSSFWQGVDVQGEALSCVIIDKLPFAVPSDPVLQARVRAIEEEGGKPFFELQVPQAVLALKQGFGRLIRSLEDRGLLVLLDPRITTKQYGRVFLESMPPYRVTREIGDVEEFFR